MLPYFDLGDYTRPVSTNSPLAQTWFDRGLVWVFGFNHEEAAVCFGEAIKQDPGCTIAWWGMAIAHGPFYNLTWDLFGAEQAETATAACHHAVTMALAGRDRGSPVEQALIDAIAVRFPKDHPVSLPEFERWERDYADAMRSVYRAFPRDHDVAALFAEALMTLTPWKLWNTALGQPADNAATLEALEVVETALDERRRSGLRPHPGLLHMHIHLLEMSPNPERAIVSADILRDAVPDAGHLRHMPSHVHVLCGQYHRAIHANTRAIEVDRKFIAYAGSGQFYMISICHDLHMKMYAAMMAGCLGPALAAADRLRTLLTPDILVTEKPHLAAMLEGYYSTREHVLVRFGRWQEILDEAPQEDRALYPVTTAMHHYARGVAHAALGQVTEAQGERDVLAVAIDRIPEDRLIFNNQARDILRIAEAMLDGEIAYRRGDHDVGFAHLQEAARRNDTLEYSEPWGWMHPPRHALGALLLEQGRVESAASAYRADLGYDRTLDRCGWHVDNVWSLAGYAECLERQGKTEELAVVSGVLARAVARADQPITSSCHCRREAFG